MLAQMVGYSGARALPFEEAQLLSAELDHRTRMESLNEGLSSLLGASPPMGEDDSAREEAMEWQTDYDDLRLSIVREDCCHHLPLDHEYGEQLEDAARIKRGWPYPEYWQDAPGVSSNG